MMLPVFEGSRLGGSDSEESACDAGKSDSVPWSGKSLGEGNPLQYSHLVNPVDREA